MWVFGYGSLTWKANFDYRRRVVAYIRGYRRRFWQASVEHRGTWAAPGRVAALVPGEATEVVWGAAYEVADDVLAEGSALNVRERTYGRHSREDVFTADGVKMAEQAFVFVGASREDLLLGDAPAEDIARQIFNSVGPSGANVEYFLKLAEFMRTEVPPGHTDEHIAAIEVCINKLMKEKSGDDCDESSL